MALLFPPVIYVHLIYTVFKNDGNVQIFSDTQENFFFIKGLNDQRKKIPQSDINPKKLQNNNYK